MPRGRSWPVPKLSRLGQILLLGVLVREAFSFWTGHPYDFEVWIRTGHAVAMGENPYAFWPAVPGVTIAFAGDLLPSAAYLPFWPLTLGAIYRVWEAIGGGDPYVLYFLIKQPVIWADIATAWLLHRLVLRWTGNAGSALTVATIWALFPYAIVISAIWGQLDAIAVVILLATFLARGPAERSLLWGLGVFVKWITAIFFPLELFRERGIRRLWAFLVVGVPLALTGLAFWAFGWSTVGFTAGSIYETHGGGFGMNYAYLLSIDPLAGMLARSPDLLTVLPYAWVPAVFLAGWQGARWLRAGGPAAELRAVMLVVNVFLLFRWGLYEQYWLYLFALLILDLVAFHPARRTFLLFLLSLASFDLLVDNDLGIRFLSPVSPAVWPYVVALDQNPIWGKFRYYALIVIAILVTVSLAQLIYALLKDQEHPRPWLFFWSDAPRAPPVPASGP
ncbi:MAG: DUF2029 domain-containing protein [Thermoplasmata archaeon]|nr:DUF2029 domain-containing protein [Thermoplasmata archaeon]